MKEGDVAKTIHPKILELLNDIQRPKILLDIGTGKGDLTNKIKELGFWIHTCDIRKPSQLDKNIPFKTIDLNKGFLPYPSESFDIVTFIEVIEHLENPRTILREIKRVLKPKGILIMSTPHILSLQQRLYFLLTGKFLHFDLPTTQYGHISPMPLNYLEDIFNKLDMEIVKVDYNRGFIPLLRLRLVSSYLFGELCILKVIKR